MSHMCWSALISLYLLFILPLYSQSNSYPYASGQAVFVQSPYTSSLYTSYLYSPHGAAPHRLPAYTTNQAVFVQQPYATAQQTVTSYPAQGYHVPHYSNNRYTSPSAYPSTVAPQSPFATYSLYTFAPYTTTNQFPTYRYPYPEADSASQYLYPYTTAVQESTYPGSMIERGSPTTALQTVPPPFPLSPHAAATTYNAYPVTTSTTYPYPTTTTATPERIELPPKEGR